MKDLGFVASLVRLRYLQVDHTGVEDLSPALYLPELETLSAIGAPVESLEPVTSKLKRLEVVGSRLSAEIVAEFRERNPRCQIFARYEESLAEALQSASSCQVVSASRQALFREEDSAFVRRLVEALLRIEEEGCEPLGPEAEARIWTTLVFYRQDLPLATVDYLCCGDSYVWWWEGWPGYARLSADAGEFLASWVEGHSAEARCKEETAGAEER